MATITAKITIDRSPAEVWAYVSDVERNPEWQNWIREMELQGDGPLATGSEFREVVELGSGRSVALTLKVTELEPESHYAFETVGQAMVQPSGRLALAPDGDGTEVTYELDVNPQGPAKMFAGMIDQEIQRRFPQDLARLKANVEGSGA